MDFDPLLLSRIQFAFIISFHILFPAFTIGLASWLAFSKAAGCARGREALPAAPLLDEDLRDLLRHGRRVRDRDDLPVRHQLERCSATSPATSSGRCWLRGADRLLPGGDLPRGHAVRLARRRCRRLHFFATCLVARRHADLRLLDHLRQQLDADAGRLQIRRRRYFGPTDWCGDRLQPVVPVPASRTWCWRPS